MGLNPRYARGELLHALADAQPSLLFARQRVGKRDYREDLRLFQEQVESLREIIPLDEDGRSAGPAQACAALAPRAVPGRAAPGLEGLMRETAPQDPALLVYTSGTTGKPKGALLRHQGIIRQALAQRALRGAGETRQINAYPINHIAGVVATSAYCLVTGGYMHFLEKFEPGALLKTLEEKRITLWGGVPVMLQSVLDHPGFAAADLSSISQVSYSGGGASKTLLKRIVKEVCPRVSAMYALTEAAGAVTAVPPTDDVELLAETVGKPLGDCEFRLADADGRPVARGEVGEIQVRGPFIMQGYLEPAGGHQGGHHSGGLVAHQGLGPRKAGWQHSIGGPLVRHVQVRGLQCVSQGDRADPGDPSRCQSRLRRGRAGRDLRRSGPCFRRGGPGSTSRRAGVARLLPRAPRQLQDPQGPVY